MTRSEPKDGGGKLQMTQKFYFLLMPPSECGICFKGLGLASLSAAGEETELFKSQTLLWLFTFMIGLLLRPTIRWVLMRFIGETRDVSVS